VPQTCRPATTARPIRNSGKFEPRASQLRALAKLFGVSMDAIDFEGTTSRKATP